MAGMVVEGYSTAAVSPAFVARVISSGALMFDMPRNTPWPTVVSRTAGAAKALNRRYCSARSCMCCCDWSAPITASIQRPLQNMPAVTATPRSTAKLVACQTVSPAALVLLAATDAATAGVVAVARKLKTTKDRENSDVLMPSAACKGNSGPEQHKQSRVSTAVQSHRLSVLAKCKHSFAELTSRLKNV